ncbi:hypothetical protein BGX28_000342 [Mortierella sp. GBA30]|nr:hypothetical protein BGX28_000342 [Mortierella sp. GBA30]
MTSQPKRNTFEALDIGEPLTSRIAGILKDYPDSTQIARELLQNSDDAGSTIQWYLLDHRNHCNHHLSTQTKLSLFHDDFEEYMGPALLAGNDSVFEKKDYVSMKNLGASEKRTDESKIGQMGLGFNSIYHLTDCPSFISGDKFIIIEPHQRIINNVAIVSPYLENYFPDQLQTFAVIEDIDFSKPYEGTIFRFPLRTPEQAKNSALSKYPRTPQEVLDMLEELKDEALNALLFLKHVERIVIYERKEDEVKPTKLFEIEIVNAAEVKAQRFQLLSKLKSHVHPVDLTDQDSVLECSIRPKYRITQEDGTTTEQIWQVTTRVGNSMHSRNCMLADTKGDKNVMEHKLIPWTGVAAPIDPRIKIETSSLFCFLPIGDIQLPFPVHVNGQFAVEHSRRDITTNTENKINPQSSVGIGSLWNVHLFQKQIPHTYSLFLEHIGLDYGVNYDLWPTFCGDGSGRDAIWEDLLRNMLFTILSNDRAVFFCGPNSDKDVSMESYSHLYIAGQDLDEYSLLKKALHAVETVAENIPNAVLLEIPHTIESVGLPDRMLTPALVLEILHKTKDQWSLTADAETRVQMLQYCLQDNRRVDLEGLPLLPLAGGRWVEFSQGPAHDRFCVSRLVFTILSNSNDGLVDLDVANYPLNDVLSDAGSPLFWTSIPPATIAQRVKAIFHQYCYQDRAMPAECISQISSQFPTDIWLETFWNMADSLSNPTERTDLLSRLHGVHLIPVNKGNVAPLSMDRPVLWLNQDTSRDICLLEEALSILEDQLDCIVLRRTPIVSAALHGYLVDISDVPGVLTVLSKVQTDRYLRLSPTASDNLQKYLATCLSTETTLTPEQRYVLGLLPVYETYVGGPLISLNTSSSNLKQWEIAQGYHFSEQPWVPGSVRLLADGQQLQGHVRYLLGVPDLTKLEYLHLLVSQMEERPDYEWDAIVSELFEKHDIHKDLSNFHSLLRSLPFVKTESKIATRPTRLKPTAVVYHGLADCFTSEEAVFPAGIYAQHSFCSPLEALGIRYVFDSAFAQERMSTLFTHSSAHDTLTHKEAALALYGRMDNNYSSGFFTEKLRNLISTLPWIYVGGTERCTPSECRPIGDKCLVGDKMAISEFRFCNMTLLECMGWNAPPPLDIVLDHFCSMIDEATVLPRATIKLDDSAIQQIYRYLADKVTDPDALAIIKEALQGRPWILVSGSLYNVDRVALEMDYDLRPHFVQVTVSHLEDFYRALGVRENIHQQDIEVILQDVASKYSNDEVLSSAVCDLVIHLLNGIAYGVSPTWSAELPVLTRDGTLTRAADVVYDDRSVRQSNQCSEMLPYTFLDKRISRDAAQKLQIAMLSVRTWEESKDNTFEEYFQKEEIVDRIKGILNDYDPSGIMNEFLQNADDAGSTKFSITLDIKSYNKKGVLSQNMEQWQGPALVIYNDAAFSEDDFAALCKLGLGNKKEDVCKIGRHGLGFNSVYHFTDVPSILSGHSLVFFDPHMTSLPKSRDINGELVAQRGHRYDLRKLSAETLADQLEPYRPFLGDDMMSPFQGTVFRIPLRMKDGKDTSTSSFGGDGWTLGEVQSMFKSWIEDAKIGTLFLNNVNTIELVDGIGPMVSVTKHHMPSDSRPDFYIESTSSHPRQVSILEIKTESSRPGSSTINGSLKWLVYSEDSLPSDAPQNVRLLPQKRHWNPQSGVAIPLGDGPFLDSFNGRLMAHLPTPIKTELPFHLHGGFALTTNRKTLAGGIHNDNEMATWNKYLLDELLPLITIRAFRHLLTWCFRLPALGGPQVQDLTKCIAHYFKHWPVKTGVEFMSFLGTFFEHSYDHPVFPCRGYPIEIPIVPVVGGSAVLRGTIVAESVESRVFSWLREGGRRIVETPHNLQAVINKQLGSDATHPFKQIDCNILRQRLREDSEFIPRQMHSKEDKQWILEEILKPIANPRMAVAEPLEGLAIVPLVGGQWKELCTTPVYYIASREVRELIEGKEILVDTDVLDSRGLQKITELLVDDDNYGIENIHLGIISSALLMENPHGISDEKRERIWRYLEWIEDKNLAPLEELPILRTNYETTVTLKKAREGLRISGSEDPKRIWTDLLRRIGVVVFDAAKHRNHTYLQKLNVGFTNGRLLKLIAKHRARYAASWVISAIEAEHLRMAINSEYDRLSDSVLDSLGYLPIWNSYGPRSSPILIPAKGSSYVREHKDLDGLGHYSSILRDSFDYYPFEDLGASDIPVAEMLLHYIMPKFENGQLRCVGTTRTAYLGVVRSVMSSIDRGGDRAGISRKVLTTTRCILARDGSFRTLSELITPHEDLTEAIFTAQQYRFPADDVYQVLIERNCRPEFKTLTCEGLLKDCANYMLEEIAAGLVDAKVTLSRATQLVRYIYKSPGGTKWMDPRWKIVPRDDNHEFPYNQCTPDLPRYMSFSELHYRTNRDYLWTQKAFFPHGLEPRSVFKERFSEVGEVQLRDCFKHLEVLVKNIAPHWTSEQQLTLKVSLFRIYKYLNDRANKYGNPRKVMETFVKEEMTLPFVLSSKNEDLHKTESWVWPRNLILGVDDNMGSCRPVHPSLRSYKTFLIATGAEVYNHVDGQVEVPRRRELGVVETKIQKYFKTQDKVAGFMDVKFTFKGGKFIFAHKVVLATANKEMVHRLTGHWSSTDTRDSIDCTIDVFNQVDDDHAAFWGLLYYFYTNDLISTNGPLPQAQDQDGEEKSSARVQYLMALQKLSAVYKADRLKALIACELFMPDRITLSNVFSVRAQAKLNQAQDVVNYCGKFIKNNVSLIEHYLKDKICEVQGKLDRLDPSPKSTDSGEQEEETEEKPKKALMSELTDLSSYLLELKECVVGSMAREE